MAIRSLNIALAAALAILLAPIATHAKTCPQGKFSTTGTWRGCSCPEGSKKHYSGMFDSHAECKGASATHECPPGRFDTTGARHACKCPQGSRKDYYDVFKKWASCTGHTVACPADRFATTGMYNGCRCPDGSAKYYLDVAKANARCRSGPRGCGQNKPLDCSVPLIANALAPHTRVFMGVFRDACMTHDLCYRHGFKTYAKRRNSCDDRFLTQMRDTCGDQTALAILTAGGTLATCYTAAQEFYTAVKVGGESSFQTTTSTFCQYEEGTPPATTLTTAPVRDRDAVTVPGGQAPTRVVR